MDGTTGRIEPDVEPAPPAAAHYQIVVKGHLDGRWARQFGELALTQLPNEQTLLAGRIADQPALHGVLARIRDLGLTLVSVARCTDEEQSEKGKETK